MVRIVCKWRWHMPMPYMSLITSAHEQTCKSLIQILFLLLTPYGLHYSTNLWGIWFCCPRAFLQRNQNEKNITELSNVRFPPDKDKLMLDHLWSSSSPMLAWRLFFICRNSQVSMPKSNVIVLSDPASELLIRRNNVSLLHIQGDYSRGMLMLQRIKSYIVRVY